MNSAEVTGFTLEVNTLELMEEETLSVCLEQLNIRWFMASAKLGKYKEILEPNKSGKK